MSDILSDRLPKSRRGCRRIWKNALGWNYEPVSFPLYDVRKEQLLWDEETDNWEIINTKNGRILRIDQVNHVRRNLRKRIQYKNKMKRIQKLNRIYNLIQDYSKNYLYLTKPSATSASSTLSTSCDVSNASSVLSLE